MDFIFGKTIGMLTKTLDLRAAEQRAIASNIANSETPGYRAKNVDFKSALDGLVSDSTSKIHLRGTNPAHFTSLRSGSNVQMVERAGDDNGFDDNSVDVEDEMARLSGNYMMYNVSSKILRKKFSILMTAIKS